MVKEIENLGPEGEFTKILRDKSREREKIKAGSEYGVGDVHALCDHLGIKRDEEPWASRIKESGRW